MTIRRFVARRLTLVIVALLGVVTLSFLLVNVVPGDPVKAILGPYATPDTVAVQRQRMGLDKSLPTQYERYLRHLLSGDLGYSYRTQSPVTDDLKRRFPPTLELAAASFLLAVVIGVPLGVLAAVRRNSVFNYLATIFGVVGISAPAFWIGLILLLVFFEKLHWVPAPFGQLDPALNSPTHITGLYVVDSLITGNWRVFIDALHHLMLPMITLALLPLAPITRITKGAMAEALSSDFVRAARAAGLPNRDVVVRVALRNSLIPIVTLIGPLLGYLVGGNVLVETVFGWPGIGDYLTRAITAHDYQSVQSLVLIIGAVFVFLNLLVDLLYFVIDPRIRVT